MATITVSSNPSTTGDTLTVNFTTDATNISDILLSKDGGSTYISATSFTNSKAVFNVSSWDNGTYNNCKLKCVYTESGGGENPDTYYTIAYNLGESTSSNSVTSIKKGSSYSTIVTANEGYKITRILCTMGGATIIDRDGTSSDISIANVTGDIIITVTTEAISVTPDTYYTIRYSLHDSTSSNTITSIKKGSSYSTTIAANNGYRVNTISCMMGGSDVSNSVVSGNNIYIPNVTGDVSILVDTEAIGGGDSSGDTDISDTLQILPSFTYASIAEEGTTSLYVKLSKQPDANTTITVTSPQQLSCAPTSLTFTTTNWYVAQKIAISALKDSNTVNDAYEITLTSGKLSTKVSVNVVDASNSNYEMLYDNGVISHGTLTLGSATNNGTYITINQNQNASVTISGYPLTLNKNDKVYVQLGLNATDPASIYSIRIGQLGDSSANNISNSNMLTEEQISNALHGDKITTYWTVASTVSNIDLTITSYYARVNIYKIYIERG